MNLYLLCPSAVRRKDREKPSVFLSLPEVLKFLRSVGAELPLLVQRSSAGRFVSGLMLKFPHCASCTVICGCVLSGQRVQLQEELVLGCVSSDGDAALK